MIDCHVVVSGPFASGKTTVAVQIARLLPTAVLSKDLIKEALAAPLEIASDADSLRLSGAAMKLLYAVARTSGSGLVLEANWNPQVDVPQLRDLDLPLVQLFCHAPGEVLRRRIENRMRSGERHAVHREMASPKVLQTMFSSLEAEPQPLPLEAPLYRFDTSKQTPLSEIVEWIWTQQRARE